MARRARCAVLAAAILAPWPNAVSATLRSSLQARTEEARRVAPALGVHVRDLDSDETVYAFEPDVPRIIASNTKLLTTAAALDRLGPGYLFETRVLASGAVADGELLGDLAILGVGDPNISGRWTGGDPLAIFRGWGATLRANGIRRIGGDVLLHHGLFGDGQIHPDWPTNQLDSWYEAPVAALSFNDNCVLVRVRPGARPGDAARVEVVPDVGVVELATTATTTATASRQQIVIRRPVGGRTILVSGEVYVGVDSFDAWITVDDPVEYFGAALREGLRQGGLAVDRAPVPVTRLPEADWRVVARHRSDLMTTLDVINKRSQNFFAESLLKVLGAEICRSGTWEAGRRAVAEFLFETLGWPPESYSLADGSGMSRNNRFTPRQLTELLSTMFVHRWGREFLRSLPYSGEEDLRWEKRLAEAPYGGNVFAKTGGLSGVSTLSGYVKARSGKLYAFSILCNQTRGNWAAIRAQDSIVKTLIEQG